MPAKAYVVDGPRELMQRRTPKYAYATVELLRSAWTGHRLTKEDLEEAIKAIEEDRVYEYWPEHQPYGSLERLLENELHATRDQVQAEIKVRPLRAKAGRPESVESGNNPSIGRIIESYGNVTEYTVARLDRDRPDLAARVKAGELSANAAAIEAGFRVRTHTVPHDPARVAVTLARHFTPDELRQIVSALAAMIDWRG